MSCRGERIPRPQSCRARVKLELPLLAASCLPPSTRKLTFTVLAAGQRRWSIFSDFAAYRRSKSTTSPLDRTQRL